MALFDALAPTYDDDFTRSPIARHLRARVYARLDALVQSGEHALELGCGTGEDALHLAQRGVHITATDASPIMLDITRAKLAGYANARIEQFDLQDLNPTTESPVLGTQYSVLSTPSQAPGTEYQVPSTISLNSEPSTQNFTLAYANFGVLNCLSDWQPLAAWLAERVRVGGQVAFGVMSPYCVWETLWHGAHGDFATATRRWRKRGAAFNIRGVEETHQPSANSHQPIASTEYRVPSTQYSEPRTQNPDTQNSSAITHYSSLITQSFIHYPTIARLTQDFVPYFRRVHVEPLGVFLPPSDVYGALKKRPRLLRTLMSLDERFGRARALALCADHYWIEFERTDA